MRSNQPDRERTTAVVMGQDKSISGPFDNTAFAGSQVDHSARALGDMGRVDRSTPLTD